MPPEKPHPDTGAVEAPSSVLADPQDGLTPKQEQAIVALMHEPTVVKAAQVAGIDDTTLYRWLRDPNFTRVYHRARRDAFSQAIGMMQQYAPLAVQTLVKLMADAKTPAHVRVTASATLLKFGREGIELDDLAARLEALEQAAKREETHGALR